MHDVSIVRSLAGGLALAVAALGAVGVAGCNRQEQSAAPAPAKGPATPVPVGAQGHLVLPSPEPATLNPVLQLTAEQISPLVFDGLVGLDGALEPQPRLAEDWQLGAGGREITFRLRKGVKWHDDKPFTAADVVFTIEQIRGGKAASAWRGYLASVDKVESPDPHTVKVTYREPYGPALAGFTFGILPKHVYDGQDLATAEANRAPIGTGPFKFVRWEPKKRILLEANAAYWRAGLPKIAKIEVVFAPLDTQLGLLRDGKIDLAQITNPDDWSGIAQTPEFRERFETASLDETSFVVVAWNSQRKPLGDPRVRLALTHALDRPRLVEEVLGGGGRPVSGPFTPTLWGADPNVPSHPHDPAAAAKLLDEAGLAPADGGRRFALELIVLESRKGPLFEKMAANFRYDLDKVGVDLKVAYLPPAEFVTRLTARDFDAAFFEWVFDIADPDPYVLLHSSQVVEGANFVGYASPEADKLLEAARHTTDRAERKKLYAEVHRLVHADQPYTFLYAPQARYAWSRRVRGAGAIDVAGLARSPGVAGWAVATEASMNAQAAGAP